MIPVLEKYIYTFASMVLVLLICPSGLQAGEFNSKLSLKASEEYHDNLYYSETDIIETWASVFSSYFDVKYKSEVLKADLSGDYSYSYYDDYNDLNNYDWGLRHDFSWSFSEKNSLESSLSMGRYSTIDRYFSSTGILLDLYEQKYVDATISFQRQFTERLNFVISAGLEDESFSYPEDSGTSDYTLDSWNGSIGFIFQGNELTTWNIFLGYGNYDYESSLVEQAYLSMGVNRDLNEVMSWFVGLGGRYTTYTYNIFNPYEYFYEEETFNAHAFIGKIGFTYKLDKRVFECLIDQNLQPSTGQAQALNRTTLSASWEEYLTSVFRLKLSSIYYFNRSDNSEKSNSIRSESLVIRTRAAYDLTDDMSIIAAHQYSNYWKKSYDVKKNTYSISLKYVFR